MKRPNRLSVMFRRLARWLDKTDDRFDRVFLQPAEAHNSTAKCGHNTYWRTHFGSCMACRCETAENQVAGLQAQLAHEVKQTTMLVPVVDVAQRLDVALSALNTLPKSMDGTELDTQRLMAVRVEQVALSHVLGDLVEWQRSLLTSPASPDGGRADGR